MNKKKLWCFIGSLLLCQALFVVGRANASALSVVPSAAMQGIVTVSDTVTRAYWTPERQGAALSADTLIQGEKVSAPLPALIGPAVSEPPTAPAQAIVVDQNEISGSGVQPRAYAVVYPYPFPMSTVGKVFFTDPITRKNYVCSGTAVTSRNRSTVDTAGHCVAPKGQKRYYTNWVFCPQYYQSCPGGNLWVARYLWTHSNWYNHGWYTYDYGEAVVSPNSHGYLVDYIGGAGWAYNQPYDQYYYAFGFPAAAPYDGSRLWYCPSALYSYDNPDPGPKTLGITCDMTGGASGGGWLISLKGVFGYVNGHNGYRYSSDPAHLYSPYYGDDWFVVFNAAQNS